MEYNMNPTHAYSDVNNLWFLTRGLCVDIHGFQTEQGAFWLIALTCQLIIQKVEYT